jgi:hypothetical protein
MKTKMVIALAAFALLASPVLAQTQSQEQGQAQKPAAAQRAPATTGAGPSVRGANDVFDCTGKYLGSDPDKNIRAQILREGGKACND